MSSGLTNSDVSGVVARARAFALAAHGPQMYGDHPYSVHLDMVVDLLTPFGETAQVIGYLHDVVEDTAVTVRDVGEAFGDRVAACVSLVTDEQGTNRKEWKARTNAKLAGVTGDDELALVVKAADRLANLTVSSRTTSRSKLDMYRREHPAFREAAYRPGLCDQLWLKMDLILNTPPAPH